MRTLFGRFTRSGLPLGVFLLLSALDAHSATETWNPGGAGGGNGTWNTGVTPAWDSAAVWISSNDALFTGTGGTITVVNPVADSLTFSASGAYLLESGTLMLSGTDVTVDSNVTIASAITTSTEGLWEAGTGTLTLTGSTNIASTGSDSLTVDEGTVDIMSGGSVSDDIGYVGYNAGSSGTVTVSGSGSTWTNSAGSSVGDGVSLYIGNSGTGALLITNGGDVSATDGAILGNNAGSAGTVTVSGTRSTFTGDLTVGGFGAGTLQITDGGTANGDGFIGLVAGSSGAVAVSGSGSTWTNNNYLYVGYYGTGTLLISNGGAVATSNAFVGEEAGSTGVVTVSGTGSGWNFGVMDSVDIGENGTGSLLITDGGAVIGLSNRFYYSYNDIGTDAGSSGMVTVSGPGSIWAAGGDVLFDGFSGSGNLEVSNGGAVITNAIDIGENAGSNGTASVSGTGSTLEAAGMYVGNLGNGILQITNGGSASVGSATIGNYAGTTGLVTVSGSGSTLTGGLIVGGAGTGTLQITSGGAVNTNGTSIAAQAGGIGTVVVSGSGSTWTDSGGIFIGGGQYVPGGAGLLFITNGGSASAAQTTIWSPGTLAFGENSTLNSPITVSGGTVTLVDGELQTVTFTNPVTIAAVSNLGFEVGNGSDQIVLSSSASLTITGVAAINLYGLSGTVTSGTDILISGTAGGLTLGNVYNGGNFIYSLLSTATSTDVVVTATTPLTSAYWKGGQNNIWSVLVGGTATNWTTDPAGTNDPHLTPSATTGVFFSASNDANESDTVLGTNMTVDSLTVSDTNAVVISGSNPNSWLGPTNTLTISGPNGITVNAGAGPVTVSANVALATDQTWTNNSANPLTVSGDISGSAFIMTSGSGTLVLSGNDSYAGPTEINSGSVIVSGSLAGAQYVPVANGANLEVDGSLNAGSTADVSGSLSGIGSVGAITVESGGVLAPGLESGVLSSGTLTANGSVLLDSNSTFSIRLGVLTANDNDQLIVANGSTISLNGATLQLTIGSSLYDLANYGLDYVIINGGAAATGSSGNTFAQTSPFTIPGGYDVNIFYASNATATGPGNDVVLELVAVPEPSTWAMILCGLGMLGFTRRFQRRGRS